MRLSNIFNERNVENVIYTLIIMGIIVVLVAGIIMFVNSGVFDEKPSRIVVKSAAMMHPSYVLWS